ncbi:hypothetical protein BGW80DRAFT_1302055 [Lactifluus volemus]|nr:hypothetical protein BGW80DRAFT_1302055 [Lactifluus volemus]
MKVLPTTGRVPVTDDDWSSLLHYGCLSRRAMYLISSLLKNCRRYHASYSTNHLNLPNAIIDGISTGVSKGASAFILRLNAAAAPAAPTIPVVTVTPTTPAPSTTRASTSSTVLTAPTPSTGPTAPTPSTGPIPSTSHTQPTWLASAISVVAGVSDTDLRRALLVFQVYEARHRSITAGIQKETAQYQRTEALQRSRHMENQADTAEDVRQTVVGSGRGTGGQPGGSGGPEPGVGSEVGEEDAQEAGSEAGSEEGEVTGTNATAVNNI